MNDFAAAHNGIAPIVVSRDPLGSTTVDPLCANSSLGQLDTYLSKDVPAAIKQQLRVDPAPRHWAIGGFSYGGTCSIQLATNHPDIYPTFIDISGELEPTLGSHQQTVDTAFGGDRRRSPRSTRSTSWPARSSRTRRDGSSWAARTPTSKHNSGRCTKPPEGRHGRPVLRRAPSRGTTGPLRRPGSATSCRGWASE